MRERKGGGESKAVRETAQSISSACLSPLYSDPAAEVRQLPRVNVMIYRVICWGICGENKMAYRIPYLEIREGTNFRSNLRRRCLSKKRFVFQNFTECIKAQTDIFSMFKLYAILGSFDFLNLKFYRIYHLVVPRKRHLWRLYCYPISKIFSRQNIILKY